MISKYNHKELNWIDLESPRPEEIEHALEQYSIPNIIKDRIMKGDKEDFIDIKYEYIYASMANKLVFFVDDNFFLSIHDGPMQAFSEFSNEVELDVVGGEKMNSHRLLFAYLLKNIHINNNKDLISNINQIQGLKIKLNKTKNKLKQQFILTIILILLLIISIWL